MCINLKKVCKIEVLKAATFYFLITLLACSRGLYGVTPVDQEPIVAPFSYQTHQDPSCDFTPNFSGTLLEWSSVNVPAGHTSFTYSLYGGVLYGAYDNSWSLEWSSPFGAITSQIFAYLGLTNFMQFELFIDPATVFINNHSTTSLEDTEVGLGFQFLWEKKHKPTPNLRLDVNLVIPTGKYQHLDPVFEGYDATGRGAYGAVFTVVVNKTFYNIPCHPYNFSVNVNYTFYGNAHVKGLNAYSNGLNVSGLAKPGSGIVTDWALQYAFTKRAYLALDVQYAHLFSSKFFPKNSGTSYVFPSEDIVSVLPAFQYSVNSKLNLYVGSLFSLIGRNVPSFASLNFSLVANF